MKNLLVLYEKEDWDEPGPRFSRKYNNKELRLTYEELALALRKQGVGFYRASSQWYDSEGKFRRAWHFDGKQWLKVEDVIIDGVWDKSPWNDITIPVKKQLSSQLPILNAFEIEEVCSDKSATYEWFESMMPKSIKVAKGESLQEAIQTISSEWVVVKPLAGSSGEGVYIGVREKVALQAEEDMVVQEFVDASGGVEGYSDRVVDFRVVNVNGEIVYAYMREAQPGSWMTNVSYGATRKIIDVDKVPEKVRAAAMQVDEKFKQFGDRFYSVDFMLDKDKQLKLIELNSKPRLGGELGSQELQAFIERVADLLVQLVS